MSASDAGMLWTTAQAEMRHLLDRVAIRVELNRKCGATSAADRIESDVLAIMNLHKRGLPLTALRLMRELAR